LEANPANSAICNLQSAIALRWALHTTLVVSKQIPDSDRLSAELTDVSSSDFETRDTLDRNPQSR
jgi:hypothetical protein